MESSNWYNICPHSVGPASNIECVTVVTRRSSTSSAQLKPSSHHSEAEPWVLEAALLSLLSLSDRKENVDFEVGGKKEFFFPRSINIPPLWGPDVVALFQIDSV